MLTRATLSSVSRDCAASASGKIGSRQMCRPPESIICMLVIGRGHTVAYDSLCKLCIAIYSTAHSLDDDMRTELQLRFSTKLHDPLKTAKIIKRVILLSRTPTFSQRDAKMTAIYCFHVQVILTYARTETTFSHLYIYIYIPVYLIMACQYAEILLCTISNILN